MQFGPFGDFCEGIWKTDGLHKYYADHQNRNPVLSMDYESKLQLPSPHSSQHPVWSHILILSASSHDWGGSSTQEDRTRGKGPLSLLLKNHNERDQKMKYMAVTTPIHRSIYLNTQLLEYVFLLIKSNPGWREVLSCDQTNAARGKDNLTLLYIWTSSWYLKQFLWWTGTARRCTHGKELWTCLPQKLKTRKRIRSTSDCIVLTQLCRNHIVLAWSSQS